MQTYNNVYLKHEQILKKYQENADPFYHSDKYRGVQQVTTPNLAQGKSRSILRMLHGLAAYQIYIPAC